MAAVALNDADGLTAARYASIRDLISSPLPAVKVDEDEFEGCGRGIGNVPEESGVRV